MIYDCTDGKRFLPIFEANKCSFLKVIYWIKQLWNDLKCDTIAKFFKKCGFVDNNAKSLAEELVGTAVEFIRLIYIL